MVHTINSFNLACSGHCVRERRGCEFFPPCGKVGGSGPKNQKKPPTGSPLACPLAVPLAFLELESNCFPKLQRQKKLDPNFRFDPKYFSQRFRPKVFGFLAATNERTAASGS